MSLIALENAVRVYTKRKHGFQRTEVRAVDGVNLQIARGETVALVGESGCGKSTTARLLLGLEEPDAGRVVRGKSGDHEAIVRAVFQNPRSSLNPRRRIGSLICESLGPKQSHLSRAEIKQLIRDTLEEVGLSAEHAMSFPHALSGGQQQRVAIAAAIIAEPDLIVLDEPASSLDVSVAAQVLNLLMQLQEQRGCAYLFITHDLPMARIIADRIAVMYLGRIVETGRTREVLDRPRHPYTRVLIDSEPAAHPRDRRAKQASEATEVPSPADLPPGCAYHPRCPRNDGERCPVDVPTLDSGTERTGQLAACFHPLDMDDRPHAGNAPSR